MKVLFFDQTKRKKIKAHKNQSLDNVYFLKYPTERIQDNDHLKKLNDLFQEKLKSTKPS